MITKSITIDEEKIFKNILSKLDDRYTLAFASYDDSFSAEQIQECIIKKSVIPLYDGNYWLEVKEDRAKSEIESLLKKENLDKDQIELFKTTQQMYDLIDEVLYRDESNPETEALKNTRLDGYLRFYSNYDCWLPIYELGGIQAENTALAGIMAALSLNPVMVKAAAYEKGIKAFGRFRNIPHREGNEVVDYDEFIASLAETPCYGNWSFFGRLDLSDLKETWIENPDKKLVIPKGTLCGIYNWWNGSGCLQFCNTIRDVDIDVLKKRLAWYKEDYDLIVDEKGLDRGYAPREVYGGEISEENLFKLAENNKN